MKLYALTVERKRITNWFRVYSELEELRVYPFTEGVTHVEIDPETLTDWVGRQYTEVSPGQYTRPEVERPECCGRATRIHTNGRFYCPVCGTTKKAND